jgi:glutamate-ammonia-ligase adenylyltransferase
VKKYGRPLREDGTPCEPDFIVLGYGKLGGIELSYNSDLDMVFLHDADSAGETDGDKPIANQQFFARLSQRMIHMLATRTMSGQLYEVDMRLRPSGNAGQMAASLVAFKRYQLEQAWTWEHQALVRARVVAGCPRAAERFEQMRAEILAHTRDESELRKDVLEMRDKMIAHLGSKDEQRFSLKHDAGGIVDIEFMVQYAVLRWAGLHQELTRYTDNVRLLETLADLELFSQSDAALLREAYLTFRSATHYLALSKESAEVDGQQYAELRQGVRAIWDKMFNVNSMV